MSKYIDNLIKERINNYKVKALYDDDLEIDDYINFLEQQKISLSKGAEFNINSIFLSLSILLGLDKREFIEQKINNFIVDEIKKDFYFKELKRLISSNYFDVYDLENLVKISNVISKAKEYRLISEQEINQLLSNCENIKTDYADEDINQDLLNTQQDAIYLMNSINK